MRKLVMGAGATVALMVVLAAMPVSAQNGPIEFSEAEVFGEINATDGDAGFQLGVDGQDWKRVVVYGPDGSKIFDVRGHGTLGEHGITGLGFESAEPPFHELSLEEFKARFPEGTYTFRGWAIDGTRLEAVTEFTHDFPAAPVVVLPQEEGTLSMSDPMIEWQPVTPPRGTDIVSYEVIVSAAEAGLDMDLVLGGTATSVAVPSEILVAGEEYKVEVIAKESSGNQTITEVAFVVTE